MTGGQKEGQNNEPRAEWRWGKEKHKKKRGKDEMGRRERSERPVKREGV